MRKVDLIRRYYKIDFNTYTLRKVDPNPRQERYRVRYKQCLEKRLKNVIRGKSGF
jgi:hypothetical protein